jgi:hypothetical protein
MTPGGVFAFCPNSNVEGCPADNTVIYLSAYAIQSKQPKNLDSGTHYLGFDAVAGLYFYISNDSGTDTSVYNKMLSTFKFTK